MKRLFTILIMVLLMNNGYSQNIPVEKNGIHIHSKDFYVITGTLLEKETGDELPGAAIYYETDEKKFGIASDINGKFQLKLSKEQACYLQQNGLSISFMGMKKQKIEGIRITPGIVTDLGVIKMEEGDYMMSCCCFLGGHSRLIDTDPDSHRSTTYTGNDLKFILR